MKVQIDKETCIGCGLCADMCPDIFAMQEDKAVVSVQPVTNEQETCSREAADQCPVSAILVED